MRSFPVRNCLCGIIVIGMLPLVVSCGAKRGGGGQSAGGGESAVAARTAALPSGDADCPHGGILVETGIDENGNGMLDNAEVDTAEKVCHGREGTDGISALVILSDEPIGPNCSLGGVRIDAGSDTNGDGVLDAGEITGTQFLCNREGLREAKEKLIASDRGADDAFGRAVALSGDDAIVGAPGEDPGGVLEAGAAYVFHRTGPNTWDAGTKLMALDREADDAFGRAVAIAGDYAIVGAAGEDPGGVLEAGAAYVFYRTGPNTWDAGTKLIASDPEANDAFGTAVAISGDNAMVGADAEDPGGVLNAGAAYVFHRMGPNTWDAGTKLIAPDPETNDFFGVSVALSGDDAIVGAQGEDPDGVSEAGAAYLFHRTGATTWDAGTKVTAPDRETNDNFGISVAISGDAAIVGAFLEDPSGVADAGAAYLFHRTGATTWDAGAKLTAPDQDATDLFGISVAISGDMAIVGAYGEDPGGVVDAGAAYLVR